MAAFSGRTRRPFGGTGAGWYPSIDKLLRVLNDIELELDLDHKTNVF